MPGRFLKSSKSMSLGRPHGGVLRHRDPSPPFDNKASGSNLVSNPRLAFLLVRKYTKESTLSEGAAGAKNFEKQY